MKTVRFKGKLFQVFAPRKGIAFCPLQVFILGTRTSAVALRKFIFISRAEFFLNRLDRQPGTRPDNALYAIVAVSLFIISRTVGQFSFLIKFLADASQLLLVTILAALFCSFCKVCNLVSPQPPQTEQQQRKCGSTMP